MTNFDQQVANFINYGIYNYKFDNVGNEILNPSSSIFEQVYFNLPIENILYNQSKILSFYNPTFTEFIPVSPVEPTASTFPQEAIDQINSIIYENSLLQSQLEDLIAMSEQNTGSADIESIKDTIINLRIQSGQGMVTSDFQDEYPYFPISFELQNPPSSS